MNHQTRERPWSDCLADSLVPDLSQVIDYRERPVEETVEQAFLRDTLNEVLRTLTYRERWVLDMTFGLNDLPCSYSVEELARVFHTDRFGISRCLNRAILKLLVPKRCDQLRPYSNDIGSFDDADDLGHG